MPARSLRRPHLRRHDARHQLRLLFAFMAYVLLRSLVAAPLQGKTVGSPTGATRVHQFLPMLSNQLIAIHSGRRVSLNVRLAITPPRLEQRVINAQLDGMRGPNYRTH